MARVISVKRIMAVLIALCAWVTLISLMVGVDVNFFKPRSHTSATSPASPVSVPSATLWSAKRDETPVSDLKLTPNETSVLTNSSSDVISTVKNDGERSHSRTRQDESDDLSRSRPVGNDFLEARRQSLPLLDFPVSVEESDKSHRYFIYRCEGLCGGWADRVKGVLTGYLLANLTKRTFKVEIQLNDCLLSNYIVPRSLNWSLPVSFHQKVDTKTPETRIVNLIDNSAFNRAVPSTNFNRYLDPKDRFIYYRSNLDYMTQFQKTTVHGAELSWMKNLTRDEIHAALYSHLLRLSPQVQDKVEHFFRNTLPSGWRKLVCAHVRMGRNPSIPKDTVIRTRPEHLKNVWDFLRAHSKSAQEPIFLMSDSQDVLTQAKEESFGTRLVTVPGDVVHMQNSARSEKKEKLCGGLTKVLVEQHILMSCDVIMISKSGLGRMAAYVRGSDDGLYCLLLTGEIIPCRAREVKEIYRVQG